MAEKEIEKKEVVVKYVQPKNILLTIAFGVATFFLIRFVNSTDAMTSATNSLSNSVNKLEVLINDYPTIKEKVHKNETDIKVLQTKISHN